MAIVLQIGKAGSPFSRIHSTSLQASPELMGCVTAVRHFTNYLQNLRLERGLACIVQSWFFCFQLALPSPFRSCADVKGCEVTARERYWVGVGRRGGPGQAGPSCLSVRRVSVTLVLLNTAKALPGTCLRIKDKLQAENTQH